MRTHYPRPAILDTIPRDRHAVIEASAGTGKTYTIEHLVVELILRGEGTTMDQILVLTFTERAAAELRKRIRGVIVKILDAACEGGVDCRCGGGGVFWSIDERARKRLTQTLFSLDTAAIGTIHGFFVRVLNEHAFAGGRLFDGALEDGRTLFGRAFKSALRRELARETAPAAELLALWLDQTSEGVDGLETLLYKCHVSRREIRPVFDPETLRREVEGTPLSRMMDDGERTRFAAALKIAKVNGNTVNAVCKNHLPAVCYALDRAASSLAPLLEKKLIDSLDYLAQKLGGLSPDGEAGAITAAVVRLRRLVVPLKAAIIQACLPAVRAGAGSSEKASNPGRIYDFDEIIAGVERAVEGAGGERLIGALRDRFQYALIDEFQDTDNHQWNVFRRVFVERTRDHRAYLIGDPKQAIYGFRGADVLAYLEARKLVEPEGRKPIALLDNYRSTAELIRAYNLIFDQQARPPFFDGEGITYDAPVRPGRPLSALSADGTSTVPVHVLEIEPKGEKLSINELRRGLGRQIAREVKDLLSGTRRMKFGAPGEEKPVVPGDIYVLTATNSEAQRIGAALREVAVPFAYYKQDGLFQTAEAQAVRDLLAAVENPADPLRRGRAWITPFFSIPLGALSTLTDLPDTHPLLERLAVWKDLADGRRFENLFSLILDDSGVVLRELLFKEDERALTNYVHLFEILLEHARSTGCGLAELVATLNGYIEETRKPAAEDGNVQRLESDRDAVQVMTIHKSKGLEAAVVFVYGGFTSRRSDGLLEYHDHDLRVLDVDPSKEAEEAARRERREEMQRLYYVALTRAKARLYLPFVTPENWSKLWDGGYKCVNDRLATLLGQPEADGLFEIRKFRDEPIRRGPAGPGETIQLPETWRPQPRDLDVPDRSGEFAGLRRRHRGYEVTSYSRMKQDVDSGDAPIEPDEFYNESIAAADPDTLPEGELPGGRTAGTLLHEILEMVSFDETAAAPGLDTWRNLDSVSRVVDEALTKSAIDRSFRTEVEALVHRALTTEIPLGGGGSIPGFCRCKPELREMEFLFPIPEAAHPRVGESIPGRLMIEHGFVKGFVDLVVEHDRRVYVVDWKSDVLASYEPDAVKKHVADHYDIQVKLYALALVKALGIPTEAAYEERFGGMIYVFLRGLRTPAAEGAGVQFARPSWREILEYEKTLIELGAQSRGGFR